MLQQPTLGDLHQAINHCANMAASQFTVGGSVPAPIAIPKQLEPSPVLHNPSIADLIDMVRGY